MPTEFIDTLARALARGASRRELFRLTGGFALVGLANSKPPPADKCHGNGTYCGACGVCRKGKCVGDNGLCGACQVCAADGSGCSNAPDGSGSGPDGYYGCGPDALGGLMCCSGDCVDTLVSIDNCGTCGNVCTGGQICLGKTAGCGCRDTETPCSDQCTNLQTDPNNCGACGHACAPDEECASGVCTCYGGQCGPCEVCSGNRCTSACGGGQICCGGGCVNSPKPPGGICCFYNGFFHACGADEVCAGWGCCDAIKEPCVFGDSAQCCDPGLMCVQTESGAAACCTPGASDPSVCCGYGNCLPSICCKPA